MKYNCTHGSAFINGSYLNTLYCTREFESTGKFDNNVEGIFNIFFKNTTNGLKINMISTAC